ncbi:MAG: hypothetical protein QXQ81_03235 [Candidatus Thorarchaeota archaeon]
MTDQVPDSYDSLVRSVEVLAKQLEEMRAGTPTHSQIDSLVERVEALDTRTADILEKVHSLPSVDDLAKRIQEIDGRLGTFQSVESIPTRINSLEVALQEVKDLLKTVATSSGIETLGNRLDDLQQYIAGLSSLEERMQDLSESLGETKEIVGIIVRQLDSIERKYNRAIEDITALASKISGMAEPCVTEGATDADARQKARKTPAEERAAPESVFSESLPSSFDGLMEKLLRKVTPQTEASVMARALEEVRDKLAGMIPGQSPILFQIGTIARELKTYPPTATLNDNDIARLNKEIRGWTVKLKELSKA